LATEKKGAAYRRLGAAIHVGAIRELTDGQLLERFATDRGEAAELAFAALVERHGPMVLRACRGVLGDPDDAEDAFQATFVVLVRKARGLWVRDSLGPWLHQVAHRTAACARSEIARRRRHEREAAGPPREARPEPLADLARLVHEEVDRLPGRFRAAVVLCDLEGRTHEQAARHLGWPVGTVKSRLTRGRDRLRDRLARRGLAPGSGLWLAPSAADPTLSPSLVDAAVVAASRAWAAPGLVAGPAAILAREVLRSMSIFQWLKVAASLAALGAAASGVGLLARPGETPTVAPRADDAPAVAAKADEAGPDISAPGVVEPSQTLDVLSKVEGTTKILKILPEGSHVKASDIVCELDSSDLRDSLTNQKVTIQQAEAAYKQALLVREVAEYAVKEYQEGVFKNDHAALAGEIEEARSTIAGADARLERTRRARKRVDEAIAAKGPAATPADIVAELDIVDRLEDAERTQTRAKRTLALATSRQEVLLTFTQKRIIAELRNDVVKARADELSKQSTWMLEQSKGAKLERQIAACILKAPGDGIIAHAKDVEGRTVMFREGGSVHERQLIFRVPDLESPLRLNVKVPERSTTPISLGTKARITVDALGGQTFDAVVIRITPFLDPTTLFGAKEPLYATLLLRIEKAPPGLKPGMTVRAAIANGEGGPPR